MKRFRVNPLAVIFALLLGAVAVAGDISGYTINAAGLTGDGTDDLVGYLELVETNTAVAAGPNILTASESGTTFNNTGAVAENHHNLPPVADGIHFGWVVTDADGIQINAVGDDVIRIEGGASAAAGQVSSATVGAHIDLVGMGTALWVARDEEADEWLIDDVVIGPGAHGEYYFSTPATTANAAGVPIKAAGTTTSLDLVGFTHTNNRLTYVGLTTRDFAISCALTLTKAGGGATIGHLHIATGGSVVTGLEVRQELADVSDEVQITIIGSVTLATDDFVEIFCESDDGDDLTIELGVVTAMDAGL